MKHHPLITLAFICGLSVFAISATNAGDSYRADSGKEVRYTESKSSAKSCCQSTGTRCDRRCARLVRMIQKRGCSCPEFHYARQPARANSYLSSHYPPFRYGR